MWFSLSDENLLFRFNRIFSPKQNLSLLKSIARCGLENVVRDKERKELNRLLMPKVVELVEKVQRRDCVWGHSSY